MIVVPGVGSTIPCASGVQRGVGVEVVGVGAGEAWTSAVRPMTAAASRERVVNMLNGGGRSVGVGLVASVEEAKRLKTRKEERERRFRVVIHPRKSLRKVKRPENRKFGASYEKGLALPKSKVSLERLLSCG